MHEVFQSEIITSGECEITSVGKGCDDETALVALVLGAIPAQQMVTISLLYKSESFCASPNPENNCIGLKHK